jgi:hypothetical protein
MVKTTLVRKYLKRLLVRIIFSFFLFFQTIMLYLSHGHELQHQLKLISETKELIFYLHSTVLTISVKA